MLPVILIQEKRMNVPHSALKFKTIDSEEILICRPLNNKR
jgi:hypothetical protein